MALHRHTFGAFSVNIIERRADITSTLAETDAPLTLANGASGVGALQFSPAMYSGGAVPHITTDDLLQLLDDFGVNRQLGTPHDEKIYQGPILLAGRSYHSADDFVRVWDASDGASLLLITYVCNRDQWDVETAERELTVRSIRFNGNSVS